MPQLSHEERLKILTDYSKAYQDGRYEDAAAIVKKMPLPAPVAKAAKETFGADVLLTGGYDLSEAEAEYGKNWLYQ